MKLRTRKVLTLLLVAAMVVSLAVPAFAVLLSNCELLDFSK